MFFSFALQSAFNYNFQMETYTAEIKAQCVDGFRGWEEACSNMCNLTFSLKYINAEISKWATSLKHHL